MRSAHDINVRVVIAAYAAILLIPFSFSLAFEHVDESPTSLELTVVEAVWQGESLPDDDEIGVFTTDGTCAGSGIWQGEALTFTAWGDDPETEENEGFVDGERMSFLVWDNASESLLPTRARYDLGGGRFEDGAEATVRLESGDRFTPNHFRFSETDAYHAILIVDAEFDDYPPIVGDEFGVVTGNGVCAGAAVWMGENTELDA